ncbi:hypothetical protein C900_00942 [Fulvivirga imtechensis AK7]|uniref:Uncharacterized protein n=2 Tax=Fulvivirga TaxID=396811 RepID=L8JKS0_9BACT|nr:hypothetical protein C900_00942 [Fulvivirga imtechensis AK7]
MGGSDFTNKYGTHQSQTDFVNGELYVVETTTRWREYGGVADETSYSYETTFTKARGMDGDCPKCGLFERLWNEFMSGTGLKENREENAYGRFLNNLASLPSSNVVIIGPGGQATIEDFASGKWKNGRTGTLDLSNPNNLLTVLSFLTNTNEYDSFQGAVQVHKENPINRNNEFGYSVFMWSESKQLYYNRRNGRNDPLYYFDIYQRNGSYVIHAIPPNQLKNYKRLK